MGADLAKKCTAACVSTTSQLFFEPYLPDRTLWSLYRMNIRSIMTYGLMFTRSTTEIEKLGRKIINQFFNPILLHKRVLSEKLTNCLCLMLLIPSLKIKMVLSN